MTSQLSSPSFLDELHSNEYAIPRNHLPFLQVLNSEDPNASGFFINNEYVRSVDFQASDNWQPHEAMFGNNTAVGFRNLVARFAILQQSNLLMFDRNTDKLIGVFDTELYDKSKMITKTKYLVYLVSNSNQLLHDSPLQLTTKGTFDVDFRTRYQQFKREINELVGDRRNNDFFALTIFEIELSPELKGEKENPEKQSWVCAIARHEAPVSIESLEKLFLGTNTAIKQKILAEREVYENFGKPQGKRVSITASSHNLSPQEVELNVPDSFKQSETLISEDDIAF